MPNRVYAQYNNKPSAVAWYNIIPTIADDLFNVSDQTRLSYDIDTATSHELNVIGVIVGVSRSFESQVTFETNDFGEVGVQFGGFDIQFQTIGQTISQEVSDEIFKILIKAKISKNNNDGTIDGMLDALQFIIPDNTSRIIDHNDMSFSVSFGQELSTMQIFMLDTFDILPRPQGVKFLGYVDETNLTQFGEGQWGDSRSQFGLYFGV
tara:strand:- start:1143 stop:1766 length:624 start_codon:yes stop_codon:yes gene_type:complete